MVVTGRRKNPVIEAGVGPGVGILGCALVNRSNSDHCIHVPVKARYRSASILDNKRVIFNINGNNYRLIVDIEFRLKIIFVVWFGSHTEYDKINANAIKYAKAYKK